MLNREEWAALGLFDQHFDYYNYGQYIEFFYSDGEEIVACAKSGFLHILRHEPNPDRAKAIVLTLELSL